MCSFLAQLLLITIVFRTSHQKDNFSTPSPAWLEYQRERFGVMPFNGHLLSVSSTNTPTINVATPKVETTSRRHSSNTPENESQETGEEETTEQPPEEGGIEMPSMKGFLKFLKTLQNTWAKKSALTFEKKFKLLQNLGDNLMKLIEQQFAVLWQPPERKRRRRRGLLDTSEIDFPPEAAIMSINFLTFAVFLIKLVMVR
ncbi:uncharacterized protein Dana_GF19932 [Drosophila ananassae]|uniref:Uncharacterized protein n=1 Tax=Drosophila ananassae TaxID=7217 RepID=B3LWQ2_DROAN|nr:uncharacterized protein Dana_GF19932 [Drosophila ananassae]